jgi:type 1 glutamine amidotransferase/HEAT repeat protein
MKLVKIRMMMLIGAMVFCFSATLFAITEEETQKIRSAMPTKPVVQPEKSRTILVFSLCNGFKHSSIPYWAQTLDIMGEITGAFKVVHSTDMNVFNEEKLRPYDVICFNNTTKLTPDASQQKAIMDFIKNGKGIVGIHAATDNFYDWPQGIQMMGGVFKGHPWTSGATVAIKIDDPTHPLMKPFGGKGFKVNDEIYRTAPPEYSRENQRVLMSLDMSDPNTKNTKGVTPEDMDTGISWIKPVGKGRLFYCSLGHNHYLTWTRPVLEHYLAGIQYALGDLKVDDRPLGNASATAQTDKVDTLIEDLKGYDWAKSRASLVQLNNLIKSQYANPAALKEIELKLVNTLNLNLSLAAKDFVCRQLAMIGTDRSVPALLEMLDAPETANLGRYALERISSPTVNQGLLAKLKTVSDADTKIGIITSLGIRKSDEAVETIVGMAAGGDSRIADAAIQALGYTGSLKSAEALKKLPQSVKTQNALLCCADSLRAQEQTPEALAIYRGLYAKDNPSVIRAGALIGLIQMDAAGKDVQEAIVGLDPVVGAAAAQQAAIVKDEALLQALASQMNTFPDPVKVQLFASFAANEKKIGRAQIEQILSQTNNKDVRIAAFRALAVVGDESTAEQLAGYAAKTSDRDEKKQAREALYRLSGKDVDAAILKKIASATSDSDEAMIVELVRATAERPVPSACGVLLKTARSTNRKLSSEAVRALQSLAAPEQMNDLIDLLIEMPGSAMEDAVIVVGSKIEDPDKRAQTILAKYDAVPNEASKVSMLHVLGKLGDKNSIGLLKKEFSSKNPTVREAAFRAMTDWPANDFVEEMKTLSQSGSDDKTKILAFRAYIRMLDASVDRNQQPRLDELIAAYSITPRLEEQKIVIGVLGRYGSIQALEFVKARLGDSTVKAEAEASLIQICEKLLKKNPSSVKPVLQKLKDTSTNESIKKQAEQLLGKTAG